MSLASDLIYLLIQAKAGRQEDKAELSKLKALPMFVVLLFKRVLFVYKTKTMS